MNLDKYIDRLVLILSSRYDIKLNIFCKVDDNKLKKTYQIICDSKQTDKYYKEYFNNKKELVSWLLCLELK